MREFFKGWRRKLGCLTLVMALAFMGGLVRSLSIGDRVTFFTGVLTGESIRSENYYLQFASWETTETFGPRTSFVQWDPYPLVEGNSRPDEGSGLEYRFRCFVFGLGKTSGGSMSLAFAHRVWFISYWAIVGPLTLLSAYLLLTKPRTSISKKHSESTPADLVSRWQRKIGFVTLVLAGVLMGGWVRSFYFADRLGISAEIHRRMHFCESLNGSIRWICFTLPDPYAGTYDENDDDEDEDVVDKNEDELVEPNYCGWQVTSRRKDPSHFVSDNHPDSGIRLRFRFMGFGAGDVVSIDGSKSVPGTLWFVPYWSIVIPLTLISACLLLSKPRKFTPKKIVEPTTPAT